MATGYTYRKFGEILTVVSEICEQTDRQTNIHADRDTLRPYRGRSNYSAVIGHRCLVHSYRPLFVVPNVTTNPSTASAPFIIVDSRHQ